MSKSPTNSQSMKAICGFFEIDENNYEKDCSKFRNLEIFMLSGFSKIEHFDFFVNLTELSIINQNIKKIENIDKLCNLEILRINENPFLSKIEGLSSLLKLKKLYLFFFNFFLI
jgi:Leucine-rich repeat (LRR) protein